MNRVAGTIVSAVSALVLLAGCGAARDIKDAAEGLKNAERDTKELEARLARSKELTYTATYENRSKDGNTEEIVIAQKPPKSAYRQGESHIIDDGQKVVSCSKSGTKDECVEVGPHTDAGVYGAGVGFSFAFNPVSFIGLYTTAAIAPGVEAGKSTRDIAGQPSQCVSVKITRGGDQGSALEGCTTDDGIFTLSDDGEGTVVTLTKLEREAGDSLFTPPARVRSQQEVLDDATSTTTRSSRPSSSTSTTDPGTTTTT